MTDQHKYVLQDWQRELLLSRYDGKTETIDALMPHFPGVPRWKLSEWACELGVARQKERIWMPEEDEYLRRVIHRSSLTSIAKRLGRTKRAVSCRKEKLEIGKMQEGYTMRGLALGLGCDPRRVGKWIGKGWLKAARRQSEREERDIWYISDDAIRSFVRNHPEEIDLRHVDKLWFLDVLLNGLGELGQVEQENNGHA